MDLWLFSGMKLRTKFDTIQTINDIPASKGKDVLLKILNSPKADFSKLQKIAVEYERKALEMMKAEQKETK